MDFECCVLAAQCYDTDREKTLQKLRQLGSTEPEQAELIDRTVAIVLSIPLNAWMSNPFLEYAEYAGAQTEDTDSPIQYVITREQAVEVLGEVLRQLDQDNEDLLLAVDDIRTALQAEIEGRHEWGLPKDEALLLTEWSKEGDEDRVEAAAMVVRGTVYNPALLEADPLQSLLSEEETKEDEDDE